MLTTQITKLLKIKYPIIGGTMMHISDADFVAAISNAGGLGVLASAMYLSKEEFANAIDKIRLLTDKPFAVNINLFPSMRAIDNNEYIDVLVQKNVKIVETSGHSAPEEISQRFKKANMIWMHKCVGVRYALKVQALGADIVTVVGYENGGATGKLDIGTLVLVPRIVDSLKIPVIGGGGVADKRGFNALLALGAQGVIVGTCLLTSLECPIHENIKKALINANETDTMLIMRSLNATHRVFQNDAAKKCIELENKKANFDEIFKVVAGKNAKLMYDKGDINAGVIACGQGVCFSKKIISVKEIFDEMVS